MEPRQFAICYVQALEFGPLGTDAIHEFAFVKADCAGHVCRLEVQYTNDLRLSDCDAFGVDDPIRIEPSA
jgi:hypothetical protein